MAAKSGILWKSHFFKKASTANSARSSVAQSLEWKNFNVSLRNAAGEVYFKMSRVRAPATWSALAVDIAASKYFRKRGIPKGRAGGQGGETSVEHMVTRVSQSLEAFAVKQGYFADKSSARAFRQDLEWLLYHQHGSFNSPVWFNCGLFQKYGIKSLSRCFYWDFKKNQIQESPEAFEHPQVSACFIQRIEDNLDSIFDLVRNEARIFKFGSGSGTNFSALRSRHESLAGGGTSSGVLSFLEVLDRSAGSVKSGGTTRRAAKMVILDVDHPEIEDFIQWKSKEEQKAKVLIQAGFDPHFEGEAYRTVSGQNSNNSVRVTDRFMKAVLADKEWQLRDRMTGKAVKTLPARQLWRQISQAAWECADPGLQFHDTVNRWHTCAQTSPIRASNPCSEYMFIDDSACNLASLNLLKFLGTDLSFRIEDFRAAVRSFFIAQEILVDLASYPTAGIAQNSHDYRTLGIGFTGFGAFLMRQGIPYDSDAAREWGAVLSALLTGYAYQLSAEVAMRKGAFAGWKKNKSAMIKVIRQHGQAVKKIKSSTLPKELLVRARQVWADNLKSAQGKGFRNAQASVIAPTGTISFILDSETTGIEPEYALVRFKSLAGGGHLRLTSPSVCVALQSLGYSDVKIDRILSWLDVHGRVNDCPDLQVRHLPIFQTALEIKPQAHLEMMAAVQPFVSGAISKTVNLPNQTLRSEIEDLYLSAWRKGLKAIAIYRDQSKGFQPLSTDAPKPVVPSISQRPSQPSALGAGSQISKGKRGSSAEAGTSLQMPACFECGSMTELSGGCFRCPNCGTVIGCS